MAAIVLLFCGGVKALDQETRFTCISGTAPQCGAGVRAGETGFWVNSRPKDI